MNNFKNALIQKLKKVSLLNIIGLVIGITTSLLILLYVNFEKSYDNYNENIKNIFRIHSTTYKNGTISLDAVTSPPPLGLTIINQCPEVKSYVRFFTQRSAIITIDDQKFEEEKLTYVDSTLLNIFTIPLISGNSQDCLNEPNTAIISETNAKKYFGNEDPIGKTFKLDNGFTFRVTGVFKDIPVNSHFHFNIFMSYNTPHWLRNSYENTWDMFFTRTYILIDEKTDVAQLEDKIDKIFNENKPLLYKNDKWVSKLQSLGSIHLYSNLRSEFELNGNGKIIFILIIVAFLILIISWINYINISTAKSLNRAKEVGIFKVVGYEKKQLILNFLTESFVVNFIAVILALFLVWLLIDPVSHFLHVQLSYSYWSFGFSSTLIAVFIVGSFLSGLYPAFVLSSFNPVDTLKGKIGLSNGSVGLRKILLVFQFAISVAIILVTMIIYFQTNYMLHRDLGIDIKNTLVLKGEQIQGSDSVYLSKFEAFKQKLEEYPEIKSVAASNSLPANTSFTDCAWSDIQRKDENKELRVLYVDYNYISSLKIQVAAGRAFSREFPSDEMAAIVSEEAAKNLGFEKAEDIINHKTYRIYGDSGKHVIGVVKDFKLASLQQVEPPQIMYLDPAVKRYINIKSDNEINGQFIAKVDAVWKEFFGDEMFRYFILEDSYKKLYESDVRNSIILTIFSFISILTAMLGLLGLAYFTITQRTKEIGIRKVIGNTVPEIIGLILFYFIRLILIASLIALPIGYYFASGWLDNYANRINIQWWYFIIPVLTVSFITIITVSYYTVRTALANPVKALKYE